MRSDFKLTFLFLISISFFFIKCTSLEQQGYQTGSNNQETKKRLIVDDHIYESQIKTVLLTSFSNQKTDVIQPAVQPLVQSNPLILQFDELGTNMRNYAVKLYHCTYDWKISDLNALQYLNDFNEFLITERNFSFNTRIPYVHYKFILPRVKISGNYLLVVYDNNNSEDYILTRRFIVYEDRIGIAPEIKFSNLINKRDSHQQVDFIINYNGYDLINPADEIKVVIRQNHRWDNAIKNLKPMYLREFEKRMDYTFFNGENNFPGLNEYRAFETRSIQFSGMNVQKIHAEPDQVRVQLLKDRNRSRQAYSFVPDADGKFFPEHYETQGTDLEPDYVYVTFSLETPPVPEKVYVSGSMNDWKPNKNFLMQYNESLNLYECTVLLKQGYYNYSFSVLRENMMDETYFEGSHSTTQNQYEILVYYRPIGSRADNIIGYKAINHLAR